ncbi:Sec-independent protein translocase TatB [Microbacterium marinilacus]|uniref:Sec-independent protein translocase TatB n=1 Tax=Microbacterium marinilacus TaxID=415209 RepID=A0ABP7B6I2_9MICO|nr:Sec-independent protein translocase TatB [Microbacterium marinilacus]MBY0687505.1 Sec-independent protein translocase TatB [Microbacterium marinilacus]
MFFGLTFEKVLVILAIAALLIGPERLPRYAEVLAQFVRRARDFAQGARTRVREEMGPEFDEVDWRKLDPRQYDPRRIIREALLDDDAPPPAAAAEPRVIAPPRVDGPLTRQSFSAASPPPFDAEAT